MIYHQPQTWRISGLFLGSASKDCKSITDAYFGREKTKSAKSQEQLDGSQKAKGVFVGGVTGIGKCPILGLLDITL